ncbi:MAG: T9SS type A sorting domain-containing protein [Bacteroidota bacterium]
MRKRFTLLTMLLAALLIVGNRPVTAQAYVFNKTHAWNTGKNYRGIAYNSLNNHLYVAGMEGNYNDSPAGTTVDDNKIQVLDGTTGDSITTLYPASAMGGDWGWGIRDVEVDDDGGIYAIISTSNQWNPVQIYYWENEDADPVELWRDATGTADDFGGAFSVNGSLNDELLMIVPCTNAAYVYYIEVAAGAVTATTKLDLTGLGTVDIPSVSALGTKITDGFWYNNKALPGPVKFDETGNITATVPATVFSTQLTGDVKQNNGVAGAYDVLTVSDSGNVVVINITGKAADLSDVVPTDILLPLAGTVAADGSGWPGIHGPGQEQEVFTTPEGGYMIYSFSGSNYINAFAGALSGLDPAPVATNLHITGSPVVGEVKTAAYQFIDINGDLEGTSEVKWYRSDDDQGTNKAEITAAAGSSTYTLDAADDGKYITFTILPVSATGTASNALHLVESGAFGPVLATETAPVAANSAIAGINKVAEVLTASYDYSDAGGDLEGASELKWYTSDDDAGTNAAEIASGSLTYTVQGDDAGKYIMFIVTPVAASGWPLIGEADTAFTTDAILFPPMPPSAKDLAIAGREDVAATLTGSYTYEDLNGEDEAGTIIEWYRADAADGTNEVRVDSGVNSYLLLPADEGKVIIYKVTPVSVPTVGLDTGVVAMVATDTINPEPAPQAPVAENVAVSGTPEVDAILSGLYDYTDPIVGDLEGASIYKWYVADDAAGAGATLIDGASDRTLLVTEAQLGKHFIFEVTPVAQTGTLLEGATVQSDATADAAVASSNTFGLERQWLASSKTGGAPWYINTAATTERGMAVGADHIYIASRDNVMIVDKADGSYVGELNMDGVSGGIFPVNDVEVSDDGQILGVPLNASTEFWVYKWADELSAPEKWLEVTLSETMRLGDKFTVTGDLSGDAVIYAAMNTGNILVRWVVTGGIAGAAEEIVLGDWTNLETAPAVAPFSTAADAKLLIDAKGIAPMIYDLTGDSIVGTVANVDNYAAYRIQSNSPNVFQYKGRTMAAFFQAMRKEPLGARIIVADITAAPYQIVDTTEYVSNSMSWDGYLGEVDVEVDGDFYYAYQMQAKHAMASYRGQLELPMYSSSITSFEGDKVYAFFDKAMQDIVKTDATPWSIMVDGTAAGIDSIHSGPEAITFELSPAIAEGASVTIAYDGSGTIAAFDGMPLAAFGPEDVENIVGSDVPVAADVVVTGEAKPDATLTGSYTFADPDGDAEGASEYQWYEATAADGSGSLKLLGENAITYVVGSDMGGKFIAFEVTPVSATGGADYLVGAPAISDFVYIVGVGIESRFEGEVMTYPNPFTNMLTVENCGAYERIAVLDMTGRIQQTVETQGASRIEMNMEDLNHGVYFLQLTDTDGESDVIRIIKTQ